MTLHVGNSDYMTTTSKWLQYWKDNKTNVPKDRKGRPPTKWLDEPLNFWRFICTLDVGPAEVYLEKPEGFHRGDVPSHPVWRENFFILSTAMIPVALQMASYLAFPELKWHWGFAFLVYHLSFIWFASAMIRRMHYYMSYYGTFDEASKARDIVGDAKIDRLGQSIFLYLILRVAGIFVLGWDQNEYPMFDIWTIPKIGLWDIALDYYFYCYHRSSHQVDWLWFIHRGHHATRHPTPILSILADDIQESLEVAILPLMACWTVPLRFHEQWIACCYLIYVEAMGHSGIRAYWPHPILGHALRPFGMELSVEDHDLHHRYGKAGQNYGKQTRIWDKIFGTISERVEMAVPDDAPAEEKGHERKPGEEEKKENAKGGEKQQEKVEEKKEGKTDASDAEKKGDDMRKGEEMKQGNSD